MLIGNALQNNEIAGYYSHRQLWRQQRKRRHHRQEIEQLRAEQETE
jgi:hypothetical protein